MIKTNKNEKGTLTKESDSNHTQVRDTVVPATTRPTNERKKTYLFGSTCRKQSRTTKNLNSKCHKAFQTTKPSNKGVIVVKAPEENNERESFAVRRKKRSALRRLLYSGKDKKKHDFSCDLNYKEIDFDDEIQTSSIVAEEQSYAVPYKLILPGRVNLNSIVYDCEKEERNCRFTIMNSQQRNFGLSDKVPLENQSNLSYNELEAKVFNQIKEVRDELSSVKDVTVSALIKEVDSLNKIVKDLTERLDESEQKVKYLTTLNESLSRDNQKLSLSKPVIESIPPVGVHSKINKNKKSPEIISVETLPSIEIPKTIDDIKLITDKINKASLTDKDVKKVEPSVSYIKVWNNTPVPKVGPVKTEQTSKGAVPKIKTTKKRVLFAEEQGDIKIKKLEVLNKDFKLKDQVNVNAVVAKGSQKPMQDNTKFKKLMTQKVSKDDLMFWMDLNLEEVKKVHNEVIDSIQKEGKSFSNLFDNDPMISQKLILKKDKRVAYAVNLRDKLNCQDINKMTWSQICQENKSDEDKLKAADAVRTRLFKYQFMKQQIKFVKLNVKYVNPMLMGFNNWNDRLLKCKTAEERVNFRQDWLNKVNKYNELVVKESKK